MVRKVSKSAQPAVLLLLLLLMCLSWKVGAAAAGCGLESDATLTLTCDSKCKTIKVDGVEVEPTANPRRLANWKKSNTFILPAGSQMLAIEAISTDVDAGILASMDDDVVSDSSWRTSATEGVRWYDVDFCEEDSVWQAATIIGTNGVEPWLAMQDFPAKANWIWTDQNTGDTKDSTAYFRKPLGTVCPGTDLCATPPPATTTTPTTTTTASATTTPAEATCDSCELAAKCRQCGDSCGAECDGCKTETFHTNLALGKTTMQSSTLESYLPSFAVDGITGNDLGRDGCSHTNWEFLSWWAVDLGAEYHVTSVTIVNRGDCWVCGWRLRHFNIALMSRPPNEVQPKPDNYVVIYDQFLPVGRGETVTFDSRDERVSGRYLVVQLLGLPEFLTLCEVKVFGYQCE